ncbi:hypothetical protein EJ02DRAFT_459523 [Clathrospora elynae]|uniref:BTB domain-containing protein n=1 Tax=Clathrospora elynae TaxID=706981 RepID=A0A6A5S757_9PLEO|nr:hypothetical protein EJ02DRAFT_459523 [Clathrospora elynae]
MHRQHVTPASRFPKQPLTPPLIDKKPSARVLRVIALFRRTEQKGITLQQYDVLLGYVTDKIRVSGLQRPPRSRLTEDYGSMNTMDTTTSCSQFISNLVIPPHLIILDISGRKYRTQKVTLQASAYFQNLLARWNDCSDRQEDGSYFIDADSNVFEHVLQFMRRPSKFPLFWTKETSFDYVLYNKLEAEADHFLFHDLRDWIGKKLYLDAVKTVIEVKVLSEYVGEQQKVRTG